ncbi:MAG: type II toxin-antitoxin system RelE/ParE family toxin [Chloroflexi bacterium]|nr:type II toxin-antitoxin system RelE/ParE family toxin [Chloroflexota bacterium]
MLATCRIAEAAKIQAAVRKLVESGSATLVQIGLAEKMNNIWQLRPGRHRAFYLFDAQRQLYVLLNGYLKRRAGHQGGRCATPNA